MLRKIVDFWLRHIDPRLNTLVTTVGAVGLISCFLTFILLYWLFKEILERETFAFDKLFLLAIYPYENPSLDQFILLITRLGNPSVVVPVALISLGILWWKKARLEAIFFAIGCVGATILNVGLKYVFERSRPDLWTQLIVEKTFSFPSGHALGCLFLYGFLAYLLAQKYPKFSTSIYSLAVILIMTIGFSRLYLGVHWPSDILAGFGIGFIWLTTCITMLKLEKLKLAKRLTISTEIENLK